MSSATAFGRAVVSESGGRNVKAGTQAVTKFAGSEPGLVDDDKPTCRYSLMVVIERLKIRNKVG